MKEQILKITGIALVTVIALTSCSKQVSSRKLDGEWTVTSGEGTNIEKEGGISLTDNLTYDGSKKTTVYAEGNIYTIDYSLNYTFDKKEETYTKTESSTTTDSAYISYYTFDGTSYNYVGELKRFSVDRSTEKMEGIYTIAGGSGDIKKNSQLLFSVTKYTYTNESAYLFFEGDQQITIFDDIYEDRYDYNIGSSSKELISTSYSSTSPSNIIGLYDYDIVNVESIKKDEMIINIESTNEELNGNYLYSNKMKYTLKKQ